RWITVWSLAICRTREGVLAAELRRKEPGGKCVFFAAIQLLETRTSATNMDTAATAMRTDRNRSPRQYIFLDIIQGLPNDTHFYVYNNDMANGFQRNSKLTAFPLLIRCATCKLLARSTV